jgi:hypothetical protein
MVGRRTAVAVQQLLAQLPAGSPKRTALQARAMRYADECGCKLGAIFLTVALVTVPPALVLREGVGIEKAALAVVAVLAAALLGKAVGVAAAWVRLSLLRRSLARDLGRSREVEVV